MTDSEPSPDLQDHGARLGVLHERQKHWNKLLRAAWWVFVLPLGFAAWSATSASRALRGAGYVAAAFLLFVWAGMYSGAINPQNASHTTNSPVDVTTTIASPTSTTVPSDVVAAVETSTTSITETTLVAVATSAVTTVTTQPPATAPPAKAPATTPATAPATTARKSTTTSPPTTQAQTSCYPLTNSGTCPSAGQFCRASDHGAYGVAKNGDAIVCRDNNGWRWQPV